LEASQVHDGIHHILGFVLMVLIVVVGARFEAERDIPGEVECQGEVVDRKQPQNLGLKVGAPADTAIGREEGEV